jgi:hypothetical protein
MCNGQFSSKRGISYLDNIYFCPSFILFKKAVFGHFLRICMGPENLNSGFRMGRFLIRQKAEGLKKPYKKPS